MDGREVLGTGERGRFLLAATFGNVHGVYAPGHVELRPGILDDGQAALASVRPGARFAYVFHGSSGSPADDVRAAIAAGVSRSTLTRTRNTRSRAPSPDTCSATSTAC